MDTQSLYEFVTFAEYLNYTTTANALHMSQSSLSRHIMNLEKDLGVTLVSRDQPLELTYCGEILLEESTVWLQREQELRERLMNACSMEKASLKIEYYQFSQKVMNLVATVLSNIVGNSPNYQVKYIPTKYGLSVSDAVRKGYFDLGISVNTAFGTPEICVAEDLCAIPLPGIRSKIAFFMSRDNPLTAADSISVAQLRDATFLFPLNPEFANFKEDFRIVCNHFDFSPRWVPRKLESVSDLGFINLLDNVMVITESEPDAVYLQNPQCKLVRCKEDIYSVHYLLYKRGFDNAALSVFLEEFAKHL